MRKNWHIVIQSGTPGPLPLKTLLISKLSPNRYKTNNPTMFDKRLRKPMIMPPRRNSSSKRSQSTMGISPRSRRSLSNWMNLNRCFTATQILGKLNPSIWVAVKHLFRFIQLLRLRLLLGLMPMVLWLRLLLLFLRGGIIMGLRSRLSNMVGLLVLYLFGLSLLISKVLRGSGPGVPDWITICQFLRILVNRPFSILRFSLKGLV